MGVAVNQPEPAWTDPKELTQGKPIIVLAPHPDDESLGCGALLTHAFQHAGAHVVCMTDGSASHTRSCEWPPRRLATERQRELIHAVHCLGGTAQDVTWLGYPDGWLGAQNRRRCTDRIVSLCHQLDTRSLFAPSPEDHHEDHKVTADIARRVLRASPGLTLYDYPVWSRWDDADFECNIAARDPIFLDPVPNWNAKRAAILAHATQTGGIIHDDPDGFILPTAFVDRFVQDPEIYWSASE